jgi:hypothetical protein
MCLILPQQLQSLILETQLVSSARVCTISGFDLFFVVLICRKSNGVTLIILSKLLLSNIGGFGNNSGTFEN